MGCFLGVRRICCLWALPRVRSCVVRGTWFSSHLFPHSSSFIVSSVLFTRFLWIFFGSSSCWSTSLWPTVSRPCFFLLSSFSSILLHTPLDAAYLFLSFCYTTEAVPFVSQTRDISTHLESLFRKPSCPYLLCCWTPASLTNFAVRTQVEHGCLPAASFLDFALFSSSSHSLVVWTH